MKPFLVDTHCHVHFPPYHDDRTEVLARMREKRIWGITIGTGLVNSAAGLRFAEATDGIWATVGLHPEHVTSDYHDENEGEKPEHDVTQEALVEVAETSKKCVAIGETGLDWYRIDQNRDIEKAKADQEKVLHEHLRASYALDVPLVFHCREALTRLAEILQEEWNAGRKPRGVIHSFTGTWDEAKPLLDLGLHIGVNGIATFSLRKGQSPSQAIDRTIESIPLERLLLETDAPYLAPNPYRGKRNEPAYVEEVAKHVASVRRASLEEIASKTTDNAIALFRLI
ncbi:TatD family hydrolase [Patescibacteria group bacterium]|nr:TatD family hydrolase [Patescibacteria group bacterium]